MEPTNQGLKDGCPFQTTRFSNFIRWFSRVYAPQKWLKIFLQRRAPPDPVMKVGAHNFAYFRVKNNPSYQFIRPSIGAPCHSMYKLDPKRPPTRWTSSSFGSTHLGGKTTAHHTRPWHRWCHSVARSNALVGFKRLLVRKGCPGRYWNGLQHRGHRDPVLNGVSHNSYKWGYKKNRQIIYFRPKKREVISPHLWLDPGPGGFFVH